MLRLAGGKATNIENPAKNLEEDVQRKNSWKENFAFYIIDPMNPYRILYEIFMGLVYLDVLVIDPYLLALRFSPLEVPFLANFSIVSTVLIIIEILLRPMMGIKKEHY